MARVNVYTDPDTYLGSDPDPQHCFIHTLVPRARPWRCCSSWRGSRGVGAAT